MRIGVLVVTMIALLAAAAGYADNTNTAVKNAAALAREIENGSIKKANESVRVESRDCQLSIEFTNHNVTFQVPLGSSRVIETDNGDSVVLINSAMTRKIRDRAAEPYERLYLRFDRKTIVQMKTQFEQVIRACET